MNLIYKIANSIAWRLKRWADIKMADANEASRYTDCFATVQVVNKFYRAKRLCDIGANSGQWSYVMGQLNSELEDVVMFEPQAKMIPQLNDLVLPCADRHIYQCALGDSDQKLMLSGGSPSASLFEAGDNQLNYFPGSVGEEGEVVEVRVLDDIYRKDNLDYPDVIKMDVQGYELNVLMGAKEVLAKAHYLVIEMSLREFYKGQPPIWKLWRFLEEQQYEMVDHGYELRSRTRPNELLQFDAIFENKRFDSLGR